MTTLDLLIYQVDKYLELYQKATTDDARMFCRLEHWRLKRLLAERQAIEEINLNELWHEAEIVNQ
jgi:hypothetical protein